MYHNNKTEIASVSDKCITVMGGGFTLSPILLRSCRGVLVPNLPSNNLADKSRLALAGLRCAAADALGEVLAFDVAEFCFGRRQAVRNNIAVALFQARKVDSW